MDCGATALNLLLRAGVLLHDEDGSWSLADNYKSRQVHVYRDTKTIENMPKFVRDMQERKISSSGTVGAREVMATVHHGGHGCFTLCVA